MGNRFPMKPENLHKTVTMVLDGMRHLVEEHCFILGSPAFPSSQNPYPTRLSEILTDAHGGWIFTRHPEGQKVKGENLRVVFRFS